NRAVDRLRTAHGVGERGLWIVPALERDPERGLAGLDPYAGAAIFSGLTLAWLEAALEEAARVRRPAGHLAADAVGERLLGRSDDSFVTVRLEGLWFAVRQSRDMQRRLDDLRTDFGLVALKLRSGGRWRDVIPNGPRVESADRRAADSVGPRLRPGGGDVVGVPLGERIAARYGAVTVTGGWRMPDRTTVRRGTAFRFESAGCGVRLHFTVPAGDAVEYDVLAATDPERVRVDGSTISDGTQAVTFSEVPADVRTIGGYSSGSHPVITRARATFAAGAARRLEITTCATPAG
ncbi:MAG: hypothetical protein M3340_13505, partial [Actinomycetota bacterium]|nr:hypothetical protein [Actinomycetota bacterium]